MSVDDLQGPRCVPALSLSTAVPAWVSVVGLLGTRPVGAFSSYALCQLGGGQHLPWPGPVSITCLPALMAPPIALMQIFLFFVSSGIFFENQETGVMLGPQFLS